MITATPQTGDDRQAHWTEVEGRILDRRLVAGVHPELAARAAARIARNVEGDGSQSWLLRDGDPLGTVGTAWTHARDRRSYLADLAVPVDRAAEALLAIAQELAAQGLEILILDVPADDLVASAAIAGTRADLQGTQMQLDLETAIAAPPRVELRPMTETEFAAYRETLVTAYAQDLFDSGSFLDLESALRSSAAQTEELLPDGLASPGHHLWTAYDGDTPVGILWIHVDGPAAFIYDIEVHTEQRRRGYGREILDAGARAAADLEAEVLGLNVFGQNDGARALYEKAGYATTEQTYRIPLAHAPSAGT